MDRIRRPILAAISQAGIPVFSLIITVMGAVGGKSVSITFTIWSPFSIMKVIRKKGMAAMNEKITEIC